MGKSPSVPPPPRGGLWPRHETWADTAALGPLVTLAPAGRVSWAVRVGRHGSSLSLDTVSAPHCEGRVAERAVNEPSQSFTITKKAPNRAFK